ncbi:MAG: hypothetical protein A2X28_08260 [Elusimicrobia bacterium GWA2_56_46]|nr:MAG: hypothetical protein A2X28_08260 [Elusimicrobia bacterium GWA2_56_46]OGR55134.1 MAG: hypothetical protein A2X39_01165 [Elusimicrobia bacterium GWC2_56_31]HBB66390.1 hypothetical protein [Elusimicrobiota bacterium]HBW22294.1 hypothetical protein [Elusimicrobiota bacterium]
MNISKFKLPALLFLAFGAGAGAFAYVKYRNFSDYLIARINSQEDKKLGRRIKFKKVGFSPLKGVVIDGPCVSRAPDFSKGTFFCAEQAVIRPDLAQLMRNRLYFSNIELEKPVIKIRETGGRWDFEDLLALLPRTSKGLHLTWNARKLTLKNAKLEIDAAASGRKPAGSIALENVNLTLLHYSSLAGNFSLNLDGGVKTIFNGQLLAANISLSTDLNFEYAGLASASGKAEFTDAALGASTLKKAALNWKLFGLNKPEPAKNYAAGLTAEELFIPAQSGGAAQAVNEAMRLLSSILGKETPRVEDIRMKNLALDFTLNDSVLSVKRLDLDANFLELRHTYELNGPARAVSAGLEARFGGNKLALTAKGPMDRPEILPAMSVTLNRKLLEAVRAINASLLKIFPITTGEPNA